MANWKIELSGKGLRKATVEKLIAKINEELVGVTVRVTDNTPPESRAERFQNAMDKVSDAKSEVEELKGELEEWYENLPEAFQGGDKGDQLQTAIDALDDVYSQMEEVEGAEVEFPGMMG